MAVIVQSQPEAYGLAHNDNPFVFFSTAYTATQRFKVVVLPSTYPTDPALSTVRVYPRVGITSGGTVQLNKAYYDPSRILQTQMAAQVSIPSANHATLFDANNIHFEYALFIQEEDLVGGVYVLGSSYISSIKGVWNGVRNKIDWLTFDYTDYDMKSSVGGKKFLTDAPRTQYINSNQSAFLYFLSSTTTITRLFIKSYDANGSLIVSTHISNPTSYTYTMAACGTYDITNSDPSTWNSSNAAAFFNGAAYYTVNTSGIADNEIVTFYIDSKCSKYTPIRLHWLNRLGGFDSFNFNLKSTEDEDIKRASYKQEEHNFTGTSWEYTKASRGTTDYHIQTQQKLTVNTDYLTEAESTWMNDLFTSPVIYQEVNNELIAMSGKPKRIKKQTSLNDKLMQYEFEMDYSLSNNRQRG